MCKSPLNSAFFKLDFVFQNIIFWSNYGFTNCKIEFLIMKTQLTISPKAHQSMIFTQNISHVMQKQRFDWWKHKGHWDLLKHSWNTFSDSLVLESIQRLESRAKWQLWAFATIAKQQTISCFDFLIYSAGKLEHTNKY